MSPLASSLQADQSHLVELVASTPLLFALLLLKMLMMTTYHTIPVRLRVCVCVRVRVNYGRHTIIIIIMMSTRASRSGSAGAQRVALKFDIKRARGPVGRSGAWCVWVRGSSSVLIIDFMIAIVDQARTGGRYSHLDATCSVCVCVYVSESACCIALSYLL